MKQKYPKYLAPEMQFGRWTVSEVNESSKAKDNKKVKPSQWEYVCKCACGTVRSVNRAMLVRGLSKSCGCLQKEIVSGCAKNNKGKSRKTNSIEVCGDVTKIFFFNAPREYTIIDTEDYEKVKDFCWRKRTNPRDKTEVYVEAKSLGKYRRKTIRIHQILCPCKEGFLPDHENGNGLDNRKSNLRPSTHSQNGMNRRTPSNNTSGVKGVTYDKKAKQWVAQITIEGEHHYLGGSTDFEEAVKLRQEAEEKYFGEYSYVRSREKASWVKIKNLSTQQ